MADPTPTPQSTIEGAFGPTMEPMRSVPKDAAPFFFGGSTDRPLDTRVVAIAIGVRAELRVGDREFSAPMSIHEVPIMKAYHDAMSGACTLRVTGGWQPALPRFRELTQEALRNEVLRLARQVVPRKDMPPLEPLSAFYPGTIDEKMRKLHEVMRDQYEAWLALMKIARTRIPATQNLAGLYPQQVESLACDYITEQELSEIVNIADKSKSQLSEMFLPAIVPVAAPASKVTLDPVSLKAQAELESSDPIGDAVHAACAKLKEAGFQDSVAIAVSALLEHGQGADRVTDEAIIGAGVGKAKVAAARLALKG